MPELLKKFDRLLEEDGPAAITIEQWLRPAGGEVLFPPTYANPDTKEKRPVYNIDRFESDGNKQISVCVIDSVPSQCNRIEPAFARIAAGKLVPQIIINAVVGKEKEATAVNLLEAGHRVADAVIRFSSAADEISRAIRARAKGDSTPLAKVAPTSLVFGMWDSRDTGVKVPRLITSIVRAFDVLEYRRSAQYFPALKYAEAGVASEDVLNKFSTEGMAEVPATFQHGGIEARGGVRRDASLNLCTLRDILAADAGRTLALQRYILGLALVALTYFDGKTLNLRQGCQLVGVPDKPMKRVLVNADGTETPFEITRESAVEYAIAAAEAFGVGPDRPDVKFDAKTAKESLKKKPEGKSGAGGGETA
jgi:CRISPR-associated protein Csb1